MKRLIVSIILVSSVSSSAQTMMKKDVSAKTLESCEASNEILAKKVEELEKNINIVKISLRKCMVMEPIWDSTKPTSFIQSAEVEYQVKSILGNY